jgi:hypothetical protein
MARIYKKKPLFVLQCQWDTKTVPPEVYKLQSNNSCNKYKAIIHKDDNQFGIKFTLEYVISFAEFSNVLLGCYQTNWKQMLHKHFPEPVGPEVVTPAQDCALAENFLGVINQFLIRTLNKKKNRDCQYNYMMPGGDYGIHNELLRSPLDHLHSFKEILRITKPLLGAALENIEINKFHQNIFSVS